MKFFEEFKREGHLKSEKDLLVFFDCCFDGVKLFVEKSCFRLNRSKILFKSLKKEETLKEFNYLKEVFHDFQNSVIEVENMSNDSYNHEKVSKVIFPMKEIIEKITQRNIKSKIPIPDIDYSKTQDIMKSDIDWMIKKMKNFWVKFLQIYGSQRFEIALSQSSFDSNNT